MPLLERVATLLRANVNDLIGKAEDPEKMLRQLLLDMENQLLQVKTQVAIAIADQHMLERKKKEHDDAAGSWRQKAALAVSKADDELARAALDRSLSHAQLSSSFDQQIEDQRAEADIMRSNYARLQQKLKETEAQCEILIAQSRRARSQAKSNPAQLGSQATQATRSVERMRLKVLGDRALNVANQTLLQHDLTDSLDDRFRRMEREDQIESLLNELKLLPGNAS